MYPPVEPTNSPQTEDAADAPPPGPFDAYEFVSNDAMPHARILANAPHDGAPVHVPYELGFLAYIRGFHRGNVGSPDHPRFEANYANTHRLFIELMTALPEILAVAVFSTVEIFAVGYERLMATLQAATLRPQSSVPAWTIPRRTDPTEDPEYDSDNDHIPNIRLVQSGRIGRPVHLVTLRNVEPLIDLYAVLGIPLSYPIQNFMANIFATCRCILKFPTPKYQSTTISTLPFELVSMITSHLPRPDVAKLASTSSTLRSSILPTMLRRAVFTMRVNEEAIRAKRRIGLNERAALVSATYDAVCDFRRSVSDFIDHRDYTAHVREADVVNQWIDLYPGYHRSAPPSLLNSSIYAMAFAAICDLLSKTRIRNLRVRGFGITYHVLDSICRMGTISAARFDRCFPVVATKGGYDISHDLLRIVRTGIASAHAIRNLDATMWSVTQLTLGFGIEHGTWDRNWNLISLCPMLRSLHCYKSDARGAFNFPPAGMYPTVNLANIVDLIFDNCSSRMSGLIDCSVVSTFLTGRWERLKIRGAIAIQEHDARLLASYLEEHQPNLRVLVLEGVRKVPVSLLETLAVSCPKLVALGLSRRDRDTSPYDNCCLWDAPIQAYAAVLCQFDFIEHFTGNFLWQPSDEDLDRPHTYPIVDAPSIVLHEQRAESSADGDIVSDDLISDPSPWDHGVARIHSNLHSHMRWSPITLTYVFQEKARTLKSLAVKSEYYEFRVRVWEGYNGRVFFDDVHDPEDDPDHQSWNPRTGTSWWAQGTE
ncbi:hypothetical protein EXIGLDRAFT_767256 [Exidia glandulosa HHB12029]|uniref:F-box domain-containing protein n=1 Tax=Exidia glandulosa HHB12029 TaxID=1314781 RepID=A0A166AQW0_EXIGL|nr:hypothetical protein EXIGLDRAFT_767256 [Exidia glandulosa HHB12029]